jgi:cytochrome P450
MSDSKNTANRSPQRCPLSHISATFDAFDGDSYGFYARARKEEPVFYSPQLDYWVVTRYEDVERVMLDAETFSAANVLEMLKPLCPEALKIAVDSGVRISPSIVDEDPPIHTRKRKALRGPFSPSAIAKLEPRVRQLVTHSIDRFVKRGRADLVGDFMFEVPALVIFELMGVPENELESVRKYAKRNAVFGFGMPSDADQVEVTKGMAAYWEWAKAHSDRLIAAPKDDIMSAFIRELQLPENADLWSKDFVYTVMLQLLFAGHETTTNASAGAFRALLENRDQWEALCADPSLVTNAVEESLRFYSSVPQWRRITRKVVTLGGVELPAGTKLLVALGSANHDEAKFPDGDRFDIRRENADEHMAFGWGRHLCIGEGLARLEMRVALEELSRRLPHLELVQGQKWEFSRNTSHRGPEHVFVTWNPARNPVREDRP